MAEYKSRDGANHGTPQSNHGRVETMQRCKPREGGNDRVTTWGGSHTRVETME